MSACSRCASQFEGEPPCRRLGEAPLPAGCAHPKAVFLMEIRGWERFRTLPSLAALRQALPAGALIRGPRGYDPGEELPEEERWDWWAHSPLPGCSFRLLLAVAELTVGTWTPEVELATRWGALTEALRSLLQERPDREELVRRLTLGGSTPTPGEKGSAIDGGR